MLCHIRLVLLVASTLSVALVPFASPSSGAEPLQVGVAVADVTSPIGYRLSGYFYERLSTGVFSPLEAKAIILKQGDQKFAWVFCDLIGIPSQITAAVRTAAAEKTGIPPENILIAATHSHTGPLYYGELRDYFHARAVERHGRDEYEAVDYSADLIAKLTAVIAQAAASAAPAQLSAGFAEQQGLSFNRRFLLRDGSVVMNPGKLNPNIVRPVGPIDPQVGLLQFRRDGKPFAGLTIFALHLDTTSGSEYSPDYPLFLQRDLQAALGPDYLSLFGIGTCGNINHIDVTHDRPQSGHAEAERIGKELAATVVEALPSLPAVAEPNLAAASAIAEVPLQQYTPEEVAAARAALPKVGTRESTMLEQVKDLAIIGVEDYGVDNLPLEVQAFRLSDSVAVVALPGEVFVEFGLAIKQGSPFATTIVVELANDSPAYIPTRQAYAEGGYEPTNSRVAPGGGEQMVKTAKSLLQGLKTK